MQSVIRSLHVDLPFEETVISPQMFESWGDAKVVLLTGASGMVGSAVLRRLGRSGGVIPVCLVRHRRPEGGAVTVGGDVTQPGMGLSPQDEKLLLARVSAVVHCAGAVNFKMSKESLGSTNVSGTQHVLEFSAAASVPLYYVSTAFVGVRESGDYPCPGARYAASKRAAERSVRESGIPHVVIRPSIVIGDSLSGFTPEFQGIYQGIARIMREALPIMPVKPEGRIDMIPRDVVADAISVLLESDVRHGEYGVTAGDSAISLGDVLEIVSELGLRSGRLSAATEFLWGDHLSEWMASNGLPEGDRTVKGVNWVLNNFGSYIDGLPPMASSIPQLVEMGLTPPPHPRDAFVRCLDYWARQNGFTEDVATKRVNASVTEAFEGPVV